MTKEDIKRKALDDFDKAQELEYKIGRFIVVTALIFEILNLIPGTIFGNLWITPTGFTDFHIISRLLPILGLVFTLCAFNGYPFGRYLMAVIYGLNTARVALSLPIFFDSINEALRLPEIPPVIIISIITTVLCLTYNMIMCISMIASKNVSNYMYTKLTKS